jgi:hypothetical protein
MPPPTRLLLRPQLCAQASWRVRAPPMCAHCARARAALPNMQINVVRLLGNFDSPARSLSLSPLANARAGQPKKALLLSNTHTEVALCLRSEPEAVLCLLCAYQNRIAGSKMKMASRFCLALTDPFWKKALVKTHTKESWAAENIYAPWNNYIAAECSESLSQKS